MNPRPLRPEESWKSPLHREWLFIAVSAPRKILFCGLVSVVSVCSEAVYGQVCGQHGDNPEKTEQTVSAANTIIT